LTAIYLRGAGGTQDVEIDPAQGSTPAGWRQNVFADGGLLATYSQSGTAAPALFFDFNDWLGTKRLQVNAAGQAVNYWGSDPFGDYLTPHVTGNDGTNHHFTGKERDTESGLDYFGARYYASSMGRWMSPDLPFADQQPSNPQSWNLYGYGRNNPLGGIDPNGRDWDDFCRGFWGQLGNVIGPVSNFVNKYGPRGTARGYPAGPSIPHFTPSNKDETTGMLAAGGLIVVGGALLQPEVVASISIEVNALMEPALETTTETMTSTIPMEPFPTGAQPGQTLENIDPTTLQAGKQVLEQSRLDLQQSLMDQGITRTTPIRVQPDGVIWDGNHAARLAADAGVPVNVQVVPLPTIPNTSKGPIQDLPVIPQ